ncbi:MAG: hypothetical protein JWN91_3687 [Nocardioides sp.]|nr:hypothetical protein [Nocardioides sp.]
MIAQGPPLPTRQVMSQWWRDISFLHWRVDPDVVAPLLPRGVDPDVHDGSSWVGLIPFRMVDGGLGRGGPVPRMGTFFETNVRLYSVDPAGRHGVVFRSLEADRLPVVAAARLTFGVPYQWARMTVDPLELGPEPEGRTISYRSRRRGRSGAGGRIDVEVGAPLDDPGPLELFLTARFGLHTSVAGRTLWVPNTHGPWPLRTARATVVEDTLMTAAGLPELTGSPPESVLFSSGVRTVFGLPERL